MREAMFDRSAGGANVLNSGCGVYQEIAKIAAVARSREALRFGRMYYREISGDGENFGMPFGNSYTLAFSRILFPNEVLVAYNVAGQKRNDAVIVDADLHKDGSTLHYLYGGSGTVTVQTAHNGARFVRLPLDANKLAILA